jgi:hypothetical protein
VFFKLLWNNSGRTLDVCVNSDSTKFLDKAIAIEAGGSCRGKRKLRLEKTPRTTTSTFGGELQ